MEGLSTKNDFLASLKQENGRTVINNVVAIEEMEDELFKWKNNFKKIKERELALLE